MPVDVVLDTLATLPTPVLATLPDLLVAFCAAVLRLALLELADPRAAREAATARTQGQRQVSNGGA
jgi:hypothetical protein